MSPLAVGLTGGIGSGKTRSAEIFNKLGATVLYADRIATDLIDSRQEIRERIGDALGSSALLPGGKLNRKRVGEMVFSSDRLRQKLDAIVHPFVLKLIGERIATFKTTASGPMIIVEAALLFEAGAGRMFDYVVVVDAPEDVRIERVMTRDGSSRADVLRRIKAQMSTERKASRADFILGNGGSVAQLERNCRFVYRVLLKASAGHRTP